MEHVGDWNHGDCTRLHGDVCGAACRRRKVAAGEQLAAAPCLSPQSVADPPRACRLPPPSDARAQGMGGGRVRGVMMEGDWKGKGGLRKE